MRGPDELERAFAAMARERAEALLVANDTTFLVNRVSVAELALKNRLPTMFEISTRVIAGGLMSYSADDLAIFRRAAVYVDKILKGANPGEMPIEQPTKFESVINLKTAKQIGLVIPPNVLARADRVIK